MEKELAKEPITLDTLAVMVANGFNGVNERMDKFEGRMDRLEGEIVEVKKEMVEVKTELGALNLP
jgi:hypothetical protein